MTTEIFFLATHNYWQNKKCDFVDEKYWDYNYSRPDALDDTPTLLGRKSRNVNTKKMLNQSNNQRKNQSNAVYCKSLSQPQLEYTNNSIKLHQQSAEKPKQLSTTFVSITYCSTTSYGSTNYVSDVSGFWTATTYVPDGSRSNSTSAPFHTSLLVPSWLSNSLWVALQQFPG